MGEDSRILLTCRVALARAVYGRFPTLVLDDVFSALDADTEAKVFKALLGPGGLLDGKCVILATNQVYRFSHGTHITLLDQGRILQQGTYDVLMQDSEGHMAQLVRDFVAGGKGKGNEDKLEKAESRRDGDALDEPVDVEAQERKEGVQGSVKWKTYLYYLRGMGYVYAAFWIGFVVLCNIIDLSISIYLQAWTQTLPGSPRSRYGDFLGGYTGIVLGSMLCFCIAIVFAFLFAHPIASNRLHAWQIAGIMG